MINPALLTRRALFRRLLAESKRYPSLILNGSVGLGGGYVDLAVAGIVGRRRGGPLVVLSECAWKRKAGAEHVTRRVAIEAIDNPRIVYCVLSRGETEALPRTWRMDPARVVFTPFCHNLTEDELADEGPPVDGSIFAGGNALRDYAPLLEAARTVGARVRIATRALPGDASVPPNVEVMSTDHDVFMDALRRARIVVVPFRAGVERAVGLLTYLSAMALGKVVIVTEAPGVRDYVDDGETGFVIPPADSRALTERLRWALDPANEEAMREIGARAAEVGRTRFHPDRYVEHLLDVVERFR